jgi:hypothetical protein
MAALRFGARLIAFHGQLASTKNLRVKNVPAQIVKIQPSGTIAQISSWNPVNRAR